MNYNYPNYYYQNDERFLGGFIGPLLLGGVAGYAIGNNTGRPMIFYPTPRPYYPIYNPYYYPYPYNYYRQK